jgi:hypothetical protein
MVEVESTCTENRTKGGSSARNEAEPSSIRPYYLSWYRLVFPVRIPSRHDEQHIAEEDPR